MNLSNNKILITGGASGIGLGLAKRFMENGNTVIVCGRRASVLSDVSKNFPSIITRECDLSMQDGRISLFNWISKEHSDLNILVNNAGIQNWMKITDEDFFQRSREEIAINVEAPVHLASLFLKMDSLKTIMNVSSGLSFSPMIKVPVYSATKAFIHSFTLSLRELVKARGIEVVEIIPPAINTDLGGKGIHDHAPPVAGFIDAIFNQLKEGKVEITYGYTENLVSAGSEDLLKTFKRMNGLS